MAEHDKTVGAMLKKLDDLGIANNTIVIYGTDNGAEAVMWPDGGITPFHGEKGTTLEGGFRVPVDDPLARRHQARHDHQRDHVARRLDADAARGSWRARHRREAEARAIRPMARPSRSIPMAINFLPLLKGETQKGPRETIYYFGQGGELNAVRWNDWKVSFASVAGNIATGTREVTNWPIIVNLRADPVREDADRIREPTCAGMPTTCGCSCRSSKRSRNS